MTTTEQFVGLHAQMNEIVKRVGNGSLDAEQVKDAFQLIIEKKFLVVEHQCNLAWQPPSWWRSPAQQIVRAFDLWGSIAIPDPPKEFVPQTETEVLLLHVPDTFDNLWAKAPAPQGYTKWRSDYVKANKKTLRLAPNKVEYTEPVWLAFDPEHGKGKRPDSFWGQSNLAASEVFSALIQFPEWPLAWFNGASAPTLSGYQLKYDTDWSDVPCLDRWDDDRQLELRDRLAYLGDGSWASPSVREC